MTYGTHGEPRDERTEEQIRAENAEFFERLKFADKIVASWPEWQKNLLGLPMRESSKPETPAVVAPLSPDLPWPYQSPVPQMSEAERNSGVSLIDWPSLIAAAAAVRENARLLPPGKTKVGAACLGDDGKVYVGCNLQTQYRADLHAERVAIGSAVAGGAARIAALVVVAERQLFLPCGACLDVIFELGGPDCDVAFSRGVGVGPMVVKARQLMPFYPE